MEIDCKKALDQLNFVYSYLARTGLYRGYHSAAIAYTGICGLAGTLGQFFGFAGGTTPDHVRFWVFIALASAVPVALAMLWNYLQWSERLQRDTREVVAHFIPCLIIGALITVLLWDASEEVLRFLPGIWTLVFSLGIFASRSYLPRSILHAGIWYLFSGIGLLWMAKGNSAMAFYAIGPAFTVGQFFTAWVLYWNLERGTNG